MMETKNDDLLRRAAEELDKGKLVDIIVTARRELGDAGDVLEILVFFHTLDETARGRIIEVVRDLAQGRGE